jgi:endonuclease G, mitochondrial
MKKLLFCLILIFPFLFSAAFAQTMVLGNPSGAGTTDDNNFLVIHKGYFLSYNKSRGAANWVMWHLSRPDFPGGDRTNSFAPDSLLAADWRIKPADYTGSGFDRGHMCPSADRTDTIAANKETFLMSNMQPQTAKLNRQTWRFLEEYTRDEVRRNQEAYVIAGCYGDKGRIKDKVTIPTNCFKIVVLLPEGNNDLSRITAATRVIAVDMPNTEDISIRWRSFKTTVKTIEQATGFDFLSTLPDEFEEDLENKKDTIN